MKNNSITAAKGIGIILVVTGHILEGVISPAIFTFHMPFFFILSGMLFTVYPNKEFIIKKTHRLIYPYLCYSLLFILLDINLLFQNNTLTSDTALKLLERNLMGGPYLGGWQSVFWFVSVMYISIITYNILIRIFSTKILNIIVVVMLFSAYIYSLSMHLKIPFDIDVCLFAIPLIHLGHQFREKIENLNTFLCIAILSAYIAVNTFTPSYLRMDMKYAYFGIPIFGVISSLAATKLILWLANIRLIQNPMVLIFGECSMIVMYLHQYIRLNFIAPMIADKGLIALYTLLVCFIICCLYTLARKSKIGSSTILKVVN